MSERRGRPGRPRHLPDNNGYGMSPREQILDAAARLFVEKGFADTSTRDIAESVGIRQASLYYHFATGKEEILTEVVGASIRPTLEQVDVVENLTEDPATALYLLTLIDVHTLASAPHNSGLIGMLPDARDKVPDFAVQHKELTSAYHRIGRRVATHAVLDSTGPQLGSLLITSAENVINWIKDGDYNRVKSPYVIASSSLRICGVGELAVDIAKANAQVLLPQFEEEQEQ